MIPWLLLAIAGLQIQIGTLAVPYETAWLNHAVLLLGGGCVVVGFLGLARSDSRRRGEGA